MNALNASAEPASVDDWNRFHATIPKKLCFKAINSSVKNFSFDEYSLDLSVLSAGPRHSKPLDFGRGRTLNLGSFSVQIENEITEKRFN